MVREKFEIENDIKKLDEEITNKYGKNLLFGTYNIPYIEIYDEYNNLIDIKIDEEFSKLIDKYNELCHELNVYYPEPEYYNINPKL